MSNNTWDPSYLSIRQRDHSEKKKSGILFFTSNFTCFNCCSELAKKMVHCQQLMTQPFSAIFIEFCCSLRDIPKQFRSTKVLFSSFFRKGGGGKEAAINFHKRKTLKEKICFDSGFTIPHTVLFRGIYQTKPIYMYGGHVSVDRQFYEGNHYIEYRAVDDGGQVDDCSFRVTVTGQSKQELLGVYWSASERFIQASHCGKFHHRHFGVLQASQADRTYLRCCKYLLLRSVSKLDKKEDCVSSYKWTVMPQQTCLFTNINAQQLSLKIAIPFTVRKTHLYW